MVLELLLYTNNALSVRITVYRKHQMICSVSVFISKEQRAARQYRNSHNGLSIPTHQPVSQASVISHQVHDSTKESPRTPSPRPEKCAVLIKHLHTRFTAWFPHARYHWADEAATVPTMSQQRYSGREQMSRSIVTVWYRFLQGWAACLRLEYRCGVGGS